MKYEYLFEPSKPNRISIQFDVPDDAQILGFNIKPRAYTTDDDGKLLDIIPGDCVYFERLLFDKDYAIDCQCIDESGVMASAPLRDACGELVVLNDCINSVIIDVPGIYRAVYEGEGRFDAHVVLTR